ncbi:MAG: restriction endonuclease subunit S, partial [Nitrospira sp.]
GWIPKEWEVVSVRGCGSVQLGRQRSPDQMSGRWTMPYLRVANVFDGYINYSDVLEMDFTPDERRTFSLRQGDILLNEGQSLELVGRCALYDGQDDAFCFQNTLVRFRPFDKQYPLFYRFLFKWFLDCGLFMRIAKQTTSVAHLGADRFARMRCISVPYDEQFRIAERLGVLQGRLDSEMAHASKLRHQKQGLMQDLLTGRVRVKVAEPVGGTV